MKILLSCITGLLLVVVVLATLKSPVFAFNPLNPPGGGADICASAPQSSACRDNTGTDPITGPNGILSRVVQILAIITAIAAIIIIIIAGIRFVLSGGDATKVATAKSTILYAVVGLIVAALAQAAVIFVLNKL